MGGASMTSGEVDYADVQGLVRFGYKRMTQARLELLRVRNAVAARSWLGSAAVTSAVTMDPPPKTALHVALTAPGLRAIGVSESVIGDFSHEFRTGMATEYRARQLGDVGNNALCCVMHPIRHIPGEKDGEGAVNKEILTAIVWVEG